MPLAAYMSLIRPGGYFVLVGAAEAESIPRISAFNFITCELQTRRSPYSTVPFDPCVRS